MARAVKYGSYRPSANETPNGIAPAIPKTGDRSIPFISVTLSWIRGTFAPYKRAADTPYERSNIMTHRGFIINVVVVTLAVAAIVIPWTGKFADHISREIAKEFDEVFRFNHSS